MPEAILPTLNTLIWAMVFWDRVWQEPGFYPFLLSAYAANPWPLNGRTMNIVQVMLLTQLWFSTGL
jgi:hypothetical protein